MTKSFYTILNVAPDADPAVIEAAYRALMKKYHPDVLAGEAETDQWRAAEINQAFQTLRDPDRRARYDLQQQARSEVLRVAGPGGNLPPFQPPPQSRRSKWPALCLVGALAGLMFVGSRNDAVGRLAEYETPWLSSLLGARSEAAQGPDRAAASKPVSVRSIDRAVNEFNRVRNRSGLLGLSAFSQDCFAMRLWTGQTEDFDFCIAFDEAVLNHDVGNNGFFALPRLPRFQADAVALRHIRAGRAIWEEESSIEARLALIGALTRERLAGIAVEPQVPASRRPARRNQQQPSEADFIERQGYVY